MSKTVIYYCDLCKYELDKNDDGYNYEVYLSLKEGDGFIERNIHKSPNNSQIHICKECTVKILESIFSGRPDKNVKGQPCPECNSNLACGYNVEAHEHRYYCLNCKGSFKKEELR